MVTRSETVTPAAAKAAAPAHALADPVVTGLVRSRPVAAIERPDLPALERVSVGTWGAVYAHGAMFALVALVAGLGLRHTASIANLLAVEGWISPVGFSLLLGGVGLAAMVSWSVVRLARGDFAWSTDPEGIEARGLFHRRRLRWTEIREIHSPPPTEGYGLWYRLRGPSRSCEVTFNPCAGANAWQLTASVWQHLRRVGRHGEMNLFAEMESFWDELPQTPGTTRAWLNPCTPPKQYLQPTLWTGWGIVALLLGLALREPPGSTYTPLSVGVGLTLATLLTLFVRADRRRSGLWVLRCELTPEGLRGERRSGPFTLSWGEIGDAGWFPEFDGSYRFQVRGPQREPLLLFVLDPARPEAAPFVFELLRRLRYTDPPHAVSLPSWLREPEAGPASVAKPGVEERR